jgi:hypothetical protein
MSRGGLQPLFLLEELEFSGVQYSLRRNSDYRKNLEKTTKPLVLTKGFVFGSRSRFAGESLARLWLAAIHHSTYAASSV